MKAAILIILSVALLTVLGFQHYQTSRLRGENRELSKAASEVASLEADFIRADHQSSLRDVTNEVARLREENRDLLKLRNAIRELREQKQEFDQLRVENERLRSLVQTSRAQSGQGSLLPIRITKEKLSNQGLLTPEATVETYCWARREGNVNILSICILPERWTELSSRRPDGTELAKYAAETTAIEIVARRTIAVDAVQLGIQVHMSGRVSKIALTLRLIRGEWKLDLESLW